MQLQCYVSNRKQKVELGPTINSSGNTVFIFFFSFLAWRLQEVAASILLPPANPLLPAVLRLENGHDRRWDAALPPEGQTQCFLRKGLSNEPHLRPCDPHDSHDCRQADGVTLAGASEAKTPQEAAGQPGPVSYTVFENRRFTPSSDWSRQKMHEAVCMWQRWSVSHFPAGLTAVRDISIHIIPAWRRQSIPPQLPENIAQIPATDSIKNCTPVTCSTMLTASQQFEEKKKSLFTMNYALGLS